MNTILNTNMESIMVFSISSLIMCLIACIDIASKKQINGLKINILYTISNICNIIYFICVQDWIYLTTNILFLATSCYGIYNNWNLKRKKQSN